MQMHCLVYFQQQQHIGRPKIQFSKQNKHRQNTSTAFNTLSMLYERRVQLFSGCEWRRTHTIDVQRWLIRRTQHNTDYYYYYYCSLSCEIARHCSLSCEQLRWVWSQCTPFYLYFILNVNANRPMTYQMENLNTLPIPIFDKIRLNNTNSMESLLKW